MLRALEQFADGLFLSVYGSSAGGRILSRISESVAALIGASQHFVCKCSIKVTLYDQ